MNTPQRPIHPMPFVRIELAILSLVDDKLSVLLGKRTEAPYARKWALPGGVLRIDLDDDLLAGVQRVARERLEVSLPEPRQLCATGGKKRDATRSDWALAVVYRDLVPVEAFTPHPGKRLEAVKWVTVEDAAADKSLAFDHARLVAEAATVCRQEVESMNLPRGFLPQEFTLGELQATCEKLLGRRLDKSSFRRKLDEQGLVEPVGGKMVGGAHRPAQVFQLAAQ
jgi:8-oxo-dGTP diphosphatase